MANIGKAVKLGVFTLAIMNVTGSRLAPRVAC